LVYLAHGAEEFEMTKTMPSLNDDGLSLYIKDIRKYPLLSRADEARLARAWLDKGDTEAAHLLATSHLRLVIKIAGGYRGYGLPLADLISEGNIGMMQAIKRFDPDRGFRLATYAMWWIRAAIQECILRSCWMVRHGTSASHKRLFFNLRRVKGEFHILNSGDLDPEQVALIADRLGVPELDVVAVNRRFTFQDQSLDEPVGDDKSETWMNNLLDEAENQESLLAAAEERGSQSALLSIALQSLKPRERDILARRKLRDDPLKLEELARIHGISTERVRQIEIRAFEKLQKLMKAEVTAQRRDQMRLPQRMTPR
jgi:RNA polymerase sigma-32 factor